jgi:hypothetical protein
MNLLPVVGSVIISLDRHTKTLSSQLMLAVLMDSIKLSSTPPGAPILILLLKANSS